MARIEDFGRSFCARECTTLRSAMKHRMLYSHARLMYASKVAVEPRLISGRRRLIVVETRIEILNSDVLGRVLKITCVRNRLFSPGSTIKETRLHELQV